MELNGKIIYQDSHKDLQFLRDRKKIGKVEKLAP